MARPLRLAYDGALYHVTARGNGRQDIYLHDTDRRRFLALLGDEVEQHHWWCYAYCLMGNHYHFLLETPEGNLSGSLRRLKGRSTQEFTRRHQRVGRVFSLTPQERLTRAHSEAYPCTAWLLRRGADEPLDKVADRFWGLAVPDIPYQTNARDPGFELAANSGEETMWSQAMTPILESACSR